MTMHIEKIKNIIYVNIILLNRILKDDDLICLIDDADLPTEEEINEDTLL